MSKRVRILLGGLLLALMSANFAANIYSMLTPPGPPEGSDDGMEMTWDGRGEPRVTRVDPDGPATEFKVGDEVIAINGVIIRDNPSILIDAGPEPPGTRNTLTIRRAGELRDITIQTVPNKPIPQKNRTRDELFYLSVILHLLTAWLVILFRPDDKQAWLLALMLGTMTGLIGTNPSNLPLGLNLIVGLATAFGNLFYPLFVHFFLIFPERSKLLYRWPRLETWLYLPILLAIVPAFGSQRISTDFLAWLLRFRWTSQLVDIAWAIDVVYLAAGLVCLAINYNAASVIDRRRLRVVMAGSAAGFFNLFLLLIGGVFGLQARFTTLWSWFYKALTITFPLIPLSFVYTIVRHKVIPVGLIIRRGLRYLLVSRGSVLLLMVVVSVVMYLAMDTFFYLNPMSGRTVGIISAVAAIAVWQLARAFHLRVVAPKIDRLFFHQAYDARQIIAELAESLRATTSLPQLLELVATKIQSAIHAANVTVFLRDVTTGDYPCAYSCVYSFHNRRPVANPCHGGLKRDSALIKLKKMNLRSLFMGLIVAKLRGRQLRISAAGMPPALVYRAKDGTVEEVLIKAMPLGSVSGYPYRERELTLGCGDVVVLMSDGLPERFNHAGEMFDYSRTKESLARVAALAPREIIERLVGAGEDWAEGRPQDDDMTFVALKVKL